MIITIMRKMKTMKNLRTMKNKEKNYEHLQTNRRMDNEYI